MTRVTNLSQHITPIQYVDLLPSWQDICNTRSDSQIQRPRLTVIYLSRETSFSFLVTMSRIVVVVVVVVVVGGSATTGF